ncbi:unnamed protein product [Coffea canephora]|uniref:Uncharacterized protein n=1 Tax=Coffea canephora TaxID=49390 RepID=A0A068VAT4_COFCA|nr:unnamed protein product [Coffea canephora]CDP17846.1 unnamed protein product [Coffea canephora]
MLVPEIWIIRTSPLLTKVPEGGAGAGGGGERGRGEAGSRSTEAKGSFSILPLHTRTESTLRNIICGNVGNCLCRLYLIR